LDVHKDIIVFIRQQFVTNSSSTSFIAYGITLPTLHPRNDSGEEMEDEFGDELTWWDYYYEKTGHNWNESDVEFVYSYNACEAVMHVEKSRQDVEYGCVPVKTTTGEKWNDIIKLACEELGLEYREPSWFLWHTGVDG
jgi:hypothetical protein